MSEKLPPGTRCVVCDDIATGNHYSVPSCNGCKTFFRRALVNNRQFTCSGNGNCPVNKGVRCACRYCRLQKCLQVGMDKNAIQSDRDRIGYTKRTRKNEKNHTPTPEPDDQETRYSSGDNDTKDFKPEGGFNLVNVDPILERLTQLENNFTLLLSRGEIEPYDTLDAALNASSRFSSPINIRLNDPIAYPNSGKEHQPFWRSRIIALYIDWAKTFSCFRKLPYSDKVALINNHASSYLIMCEVFRTPEHIEEIEDCLTKVIGAPGGSSTVMSVVLNNEVAKSFATALEMKTKVKREPSEAMIRLPTEYGSLPPEYGQWIPEDYGTPSAGTEGCPDMHKLFNNNMAPSPGYGSNEHGINIRPPFPRFSDFSATELTPVMAAMIEYMMKPFRQLNISTTEFAALQSVMFFDPDTDGLDAASQRNVEAEQQRLLAALHRYLMKNYTTVEANERYSNILLRIPTIRKVAAKKNESLQMIDMLNLFSLNSLVKETALGPRGARSGNNFLFE